MKLVKLLLLIILYSVPTSAQTIKIWTANVQHGVGTDGSTNYTRQANILKGSSADIVLMQERTSGDSGWNSPMSGFTERVYRENDPTQGDGPSIWTNNSTTTVHNIYEHDLSQNAVAAWSGTNVDKAAVGIDVTVAGKRFYLFNTHLAWSAGADCDGCQTSAIREAQINELLSWINSIVGTNLNVVIAGDMNFSPTMPKISGGFQIDLFTNVGYTSAKTLGNNISTFTVNWGDRNSDGIQDNSTINPITHDTREIDYFFVKNGATNITFSALDLPDLRVTCPHALVNNGGSFPACTPEVGQFDSTQLADTTGDFGVRPSDHNWELLTLVPTTIPPLVYNAPTHRISITPPSVTGGVSNPLDLTVVGRGINYTFIDPNFGTTITRCTDENFWPDQPGRNFMPPDTAEVRSWSIDHTKLYILNIEGGVITPIYWNATTKQCIRMGNTSITSGGIWLSGIVDGGVSLPSWSGKDANIMYGTFGFKLRRLDFSSITSSSTTVPFTDILDYQTVFTAIGGGTLTGSVCSLGITGVASSIDFVVTAINGNQDSWNKIVWFDTSTNAYKVLDTTTTPLRYWNSITSSWTNISGTTGGWGVHNVKSDKGGRYALVTISSSDNPGAGNGRFGIWDTISNTFIYTNTDLDGGHRSGGVGYQVNQYANGSEAAQWLLRDLTNSATFNTPTFLINPQLNDPTSSTVYAAQNPIFDEHSSWDNARSGTLYPFFSLTSRSIPVDGAHPHRAWDNEGLAVRTDSVGNSSVFRLFHHHSKRIFPTPDPYDYYHYSFGQISSDGLFAVFSSNWEMSLIYPTGVDPDTQLSCAPSCKRLDTFIATLPVSSALIVVKKCNWHANPRCNQ